MKKFEKYTRFYYDKKGVTLRPNGEKKTFSFSLSPERGKRYRLFATGETALFYQWKNEPDNPNIYRSIEDSLSESEAELSAFALSLSSKAPAAFVRRAYKKILFPPRLSYLDLAPVPQEWELAVRVKGRGVEISENGYLRVRAVVRYLKDGVSRHSTNESPDEIHIIDIPAGDYPYTRLCRKMHLPDGEIASVGIFVEGKEYSGDVYIEEPEFIGGGYNILPPFAPAIQGKEHFDWTGQYLSRKEWPEFRITLRGKTVFEGEIFERCHRNSEWEAELPSELLSDNNELGIELISNYRGALPYRLRELGIIESPASDFEIIKVPEAVGTSSASAALIRTENDGMTIKAEWSEHVSGESEFYFAERGLHAIGFRTDEHPAENITFTLTSGETTKLGVIERSVIKERDNVYTGTGDIIYVNQNKRSLEDFFCWYVSEDIGNLLTIRPTYRWSGSRQADEKTFRELCSIMNELGIKYSHMLDGRELEGLDGNPSSASLAGEGFLGRQMHERDGAMFYWQRYTRDLSLTQEQYDDMGIEICREDPERANPTFNGQTFVYLVGKHERKSDGPNSPTFAGDSVDGEKLFLHKAPTIPLDMKAAHDYTVQRLREIRAPGVTRHTGPSACFKYFFEAGFDWAGAETMYGTLEPIMAFLRGAVQGVGSRDLGVHHALQWSSSPQDAPEHVRRYRLALYVSYMQGATEINTEEGLWRLEEYYSDFHRFSSACTQHADMQRDFYKYLTTHTRRGSFYTPVALVHGRYDGFNGFKRNVPWGYSGITDTDAEKSWDLLRTFYPESTFGDAIYFHNCPTDKAIGFNTSTPSGNVDIIPMENASGTIGKYRAAAFMGYNKFEMGDADTLLRFVESGGRLLLTLAHLTSTTDYKKILSGELSFDESPLGLTKGAPSFKTDSVGGISLPICINEATPDEILEKTDGGAPLVTLYKIGRGEITLFASPI